MHDLDLNLLVALDALLREGSVTRAAEQLNLSPSATSRALGRLREATGDPLLTRAGRALVPTRYARCLAPRVQAALEEARALLGPPVAPPPSQWTRSFQIRADDAIAAMMGPALLHRMAATAPGLSVVFRAEGDEDVDSLRDGRVDLDVGVQDALGPEIRVRKLFDDRRVVLRRHRRNRKSTRPSKADKADKLTLSAYAGATHVDISRRGRRHGPIDDALAERGLSRKVSAVVPTHLGAAMLVAQSDALSLVSAHFAERIRTLLPVEALPAPTALPRATIALAFHPRHEADPAHRWLREQMAEIARGLSKGPPR